MSVEHSHSADAADTLVGGSIRRSLWFIIGLLAVITAAALIILWPSEPVPTTPLGERTPGTVTEVSDCKPVAEDCVTLTIEVAEGLFAGENVKTDAFQTRNSPEIAVGTQVWLVESNTEPGEFALSDIDRQSSLLWLAGLFAVAVVLFARWKGVSALAGLVSSMALLIWFILPSILLGKDPVVIAAVGTAAIAIVAMFLAHGPHVGTVVAIVGTVLALFLTLALAWLFTGFVSLSGMGDEGSYFLDLQGMEFDLRGLFLAGVVIGALGVLDDVTITQAAAVAEVKRADPSARWPQLFGAGMRVGRDHVAATVNTLVLAYVGAALPTFILLTMSDLGLLQSINNEVIAQEIVRALIGGLGIIAAVPITTALMAAILTDHQHVDEASTAEADEESAFWGSDK
ncbi:MAG: YibE/F family protein [Actinomycetia bacterium]|nr:YibE/F family protein [Actinomycetes bacterium]MCH9801836.1 YibE/F family protein [Actinomycetes bacterium]